MRSCSIRLGSGTFGTVYKALYVETNESVAVKRVYQDPQYKKDVEDINKIPLSALSAAGATCAGGGQDAANGAVFVLWRKQLRPAVQLCPKRWLLTLPGADAALTVREAMSGDVPLSCSWHGSSPDLAAVVQQQFSSEQLSPHRRPDQKY